MNKYILIHGDWDEKQEAPAYHFTAVEYPFHLKTLDTEEQDMMNDYGINNILPHGSLVEIKSMEEYKRIIMEANMYGTASVSLYATENELEYKYPHEILEEHRVVI